MVELGRALIRAEIVLVPTPPDFCIVPRFSIVPVTSELVISKSP